MGCRKRLVGFKIIPRGGGNWAFFFSAETMSFCYIEVIYCSERLTFVWIEKLYIKQVTIMSNEVGQF